MSILISLSLHARSHRISLTSSPQQQPLLAATQFKRLSLEKNLTVLSLYDLEIGLLGKYMYTTVHRYVDSNMFLLFWMTENKVLAILQKWFIWLISLPQWSGLSFISSHTVGSCRACQASYLHKPHLLSQCQCETPQCHLHSGLDISAEHIGSMEILVQTATVPKRGAHLLSRLIKQKARDQCQHAVAITHQPSSPAL